MMIAGCGGHATASSGPSVRKCDKPPQARASGQPSTAPLKIGSLSFVGPPEFAAVDMANQTVDRELGQGAQVIIGAAASGATKLVIDKITGAGVRCNRNDRLQ
jgi:branched-chain amino acid transport system substrate-binding protein